MKKNIIIISSVVLVIGLIIGGVYIWASNSPEVTFSIGKPVEETDIYIEHLSLGYRERFGFIPMSDAFQEEYFRMGEDMTGITADLMKTAEAPTHLELDITKDDEGRTVCTYHGTLTKGGVTSEYEQSWTFDYKHFGEIKYVG